MKRFQILTEADARVLDHGSSVVLVRGGQVTPLAADTLRARRVTVIRESGDADSVALAPVSEIRVIAIGSDHNGVALKQFLRQGLPFTISEPIRTRPWIIQRSRRPWPGR